MGRPLEFKQRVHLPMDVALEPRVSRPLNPTYVGALLWCAVVFAGYHGLQRWLTRQDLDVSEISRARLLAVEPTEAEPAPPTEPVAAQARAVPPALPTAPRPLPAPTSSLVRGALDDPAATADLDSSNPLSSHDALDEREPPRPAPLPPPRALAGVRKVPAVRPRRTPRAESRPVPPRVAMSHIDEPPIASWAERTPAPNVSSMPPRPPPSVEPPPAVEAGSSCEGAVAKYNEEINLERPGSIPDISAETYAGILNNGSYFAHCGIPAHVRVNICAAVQRGRAIGVTVRTNPAQREGERCVRSAVRRLRFPYHPKLDVTRTEFAPN